MKRLIIAVSLVVVAALSISALAQRATEAETLFHRGVHFEEVRGELKEAIAIFEKLVKDYPENRPLAAKAYYHLGICYEKMGRDQAANAFKAIVEKYPDQTETVLLAKERLSLLAKPEPPAEKISEELKISLVWQGEGMDSTGEISPDGRFLSCVDWTTGDLAVRNMITGEVRRLTSKEGSPAGPYEAPDSSVWSPDSKQIAYSWYKDGEFIDLRIIGLDDSKPRVLFRGDYSKDWISPYDWSPDGRYILARFSRSKESGGPSRELGLVSVQDGSVRYLECEQGIEIGLAKFSQDGHYIAFDHSHLQDPSKSDLSVIPIGGKERREIINHPADDRLLGWTPDGKSILFLSDRTGSWDAWLVRVTDGRSQNAPRLVKRALGRIGTMGLTQNGSLYYSNPGFMWDIFSASIDPDSASLLEEPSKMHLTYEGHNYQPRLSPEGNRLAYISLREKWNSVLTLFSFESGEVHDIPLQGDFPSSFGICDWMPDGRSILLNALSNSRGRGFFKVDIHTGDTKLLLREDDFLEGSPDRSNIRISHDGQSLFFFYQGQDKFLRVMKRHLDSKEEKEICRLPIHNPTDNNTLRLSPDGLWLALLLRDQKNLRSIKVLPVSGGEIKEIHRFEQGGRWIIDMEWSPDSRYLYFSKQVDSTEEIGLWQLWRVPSAGGDAQNLGISANRILGLNIRPDGEQIIFHSRTAGEQTGAIWAMKNFLPTTEPKDIIVRRVFQDTGTGVVGSPSPDGRFLSDIDRTTGNLVVRDLASGSVRPVTNVPGIWDEYALYSIFSADGRKLAYTWFNKEGKLEIRTIGLDGTGGKTVLGGVNAVDVGPLGWSSDGRDILAFIYRVGGISEIVLISVENASSRVIRKLDGIPLGTARLSPDGRFVAYDRAVENPARNDDIFLIPVGGGEDIPLVRHEAMDRLLGWTPDGKGILFASDRTGSTDAWVIRVADGKPLGDPVLVKKGLGQISPIGFDRNGSFFYGIQAQVFDVYTASVDVETGKMLTPPAPIAKRYVGSNDSPGWSPDGETLAYVLRSSAASRSLLCLHSMKSGEERDLSLEMYVRWPQWSPDGRRILVWGRKDPADYGYYFVDPRTGSVAPFVLNTETHSVYRAVWSPDGKAVYFVRSSIDPNGESRLIRRDIETGRETEILRDTLITGIAVSPDGRNIAFRSYDDPDVTLMIMPSSGGEIQELVRVKKPDVISMANVPFWTPDGRHLLYPVTRLHAEGGTTTKLWRLDLKTGEAKPLDLTRSPMLTLAIHPDGKRIAFESGEPKIEIWVMENFLDKN